MLAPFFSSSVDVTATISELILTSISQKSNLLDSFVITYATIVASLYRLIGIEFGKKRSLTPLQYDNDLTM